MPVHASPQRPFHPLIFQLSGFFAHRLAVTANPPRLQLKLGQIDDFHYDFRIIVFGHACDRFIPSFGRFAPGARAQ